jgi:hypothetical protein
VTCDFLRVTRMTRCVISTFQIRIDAGSGSKDAVFNVNEQVPSDVRWLICCVQFFSWQLRPLLRAFDVVAEWSG